MSCILCKKNDFKTVSTVDSKTKSFLKVVFCKSCGMVQQNPIPSEKEVYEFYSKDYRQEYKKTYLPKIKHVFRAGKLAVERINFLKERNISKGSLLDVGAGGGEFTYISGRSGFIAEGIEPNEGYSHYARHEYGVDIKTGQLSDVKKKFDLITMFHALEHIPDPVKAFKLLYGLLNKDGVLFIEVPNLETNDASPHNIYFKAHIHYFTESTLICAASRYFEKLDSDVGSNLRILFIKKNHAENNIIFPSINKVNQTELRIRKKGWIEYVFYGKSYKKILARIKQLFFESNLKYDSSINLLDDILEGKI